MFLIISKQYIKRKGADNMDKNVGELDSILRIVFGAALAPLFFFTKGLGKMLGIAGIALLITGKTQKCGMYQVTGTNTLKKD